MMRMEEKLTPIKINTCASWTVSGCLDARFGGKQVHIVTSTYIKGYIVLAIGDNLGALGSVAIGREVLTLDDCARCYVAIRICETEYIEQI